MSVPKIPVKIKHTGDTHLPDVESDLEVEEATSSLGHLAQPRDQGGRPAVRHAGILLAPEDDTAVDATAGARDAGTSRTTPGRGAAARQDAPGEDAGRGDRQPQGLGAAPPQTQGAPRSATVAWIGALAAAVLLVRLLR